MKIWIAVLVILGLMSSIQAKAELRSNTIWKVDKPNLKISVGCDPDVVGTIQNKINQGFQTSGGSTMNAGIYIQGEMDNAYPGTRWDAIVSTGPFFGIAYVYDGCAVYVENYGPYQWSSWIWRTP